MDDITANPSRSVVPGDQTTTQVNLPPSEAQPAAGKADMTAWLRRHWRLVAPLTIAVVISGSALALTLKPHPARSASVAAKQTPSPTPTPVPTPVIKLSPLTGLPVDPTLAARPISGVMVENLYPNARPQSGLQSAGVVYEALAEGGITRFLALFGDTASPSIGPIRSLRPYYIDWALEFGASLSHAGGSSDALNLVGPLGVKDLNALVIGSPTYFRTADRYAPHNLYTSSALLDAVNASHGFTQAPNFTQTPRKPDAPDPSPPHTIISIDFSSAAYAVQYRYDPKANNYVRYLYGTPHIDRNTGAAINVKNIVIETMPVTYTPAPHNSQYVNMPTVGSGSAVVFRDGDAVVGTWTKANHNDRTLLTDAAGKPIALDNGNTWYEIVPTGNTVTY
jgi:hypothetical protein